MGTAQPTIARLERGDYRGYTVMTLAKAALALGRSLRLGLGPARRHTSMAGRRMLRKAKRR